MKNKNLIIVLVIVIIVLIIGFVIARTEEAKNPSLRDDAMLEDQGLTETINVKHQYKDGEHVFVGTIILPTSCHSYNAEVIDSETGPEIRISINDPAEGQVCAQVVTERDFKVTYKSDDPDQAFRLFVNGEEYKLNLFEVSPNEDIDTFELFIKG